MFNILKVISLTIINTNFSIKKNYLHFPSHAMLLFFPFFIVSIVKTEINTSIKKYSDKKEQSLKKKHTKRIPNNNFFTFTFQQILYIHFKSQSSQSVEEIIHTISSFGRHSPKFSIHFQRHFYSFVFYRHISCRGLSENY